LKNAVKCIAELITVHSEQNVDFNDVKSILKNSGSAMLGIAEASGADRITEALHDALNCPLLAEEHISNAKNFLFSITYGTDNELTMGEFQNLTIEFEKLKNKNANVIWGRNEDPTLGDKIKLSVIISNYSTDIPENSAIGEVKDIFDGDKDPNAEIVSKGNTYSFDSSPGNMKSEVDKKAENPVKVDDGLGFLKTPDHIATKETIKEIEPVFVPELVTESAPSLGVAPQRIRSTYEPKYEIDSQFAFLVDTPAIERLRQENQADFQDKAILHNQPAAVPVDNDLHDFFRSLPD